MIVLGEIQMQDKSGKNWVFSLWVAMSLVASATEMPESWPTQANLLPSAEKLTEWTQPPPYEMKNKSYNDSRKF